MEKNALKIVSYILFFGAVFVTVIFGLNRLSAVLAQDIDDSGVTYPIEELGDCGDKQECKSYCDISANQEKCLDFAESNGMMKKQDVEKAKSVLKLAEEGIDTPGGCKGEQECEAYCDDTSHLDECVSFAEKAGIMSSEEVKMVKATGGVGPGGCKGKKACDAYCESEANLDECIGFASQHGLMTEQEAEMVKKTKGKGPGGCASKESCDAYCQQESNFESCLEFGHEYGMMTDEEYETAKKMGPKMMNQGGPGGCKNKEECDAFCGQEANFETCVEFGHENGLMSDEEYETAKKMGPAAMQGGPGGCKEKEECEAFCNEPTNAEECLTFAIESGMMSQEEIDQMKEGGFMAPPQDMIGPGGEFIGPGGCKTQEECAAFCSDETNSGVCSVFGAGPQIGPNEEDFQSGVRGPGDCDSPEACMRFCSQPENEETCTNFGPSGNKEYHRPEDDINYPQGPPEDGSYGPDNMGPPCNSEEECRAMTRPEGEPENYQDYQKPDFQSGSSWQGPSEDQVVPIQPQYPQYPAEDRNYKGEPEFQQPEYQQPEYKQPEFQEPAVDQYRQEPMMPVPEIQPAPQIQQAPMEQAPMMEQAPAPESAPPPPSTEAPPTSFNLVNLLASMIFVWLR